MACGCDWLGFVGYCYSGYGGYARGLSRTRASSRVIRNDKKYSLINPFWFDTRVEAFICMEEIVLGKKISSQVRSSRREADFCPIARFVDG